MPRPTTSTVLVAEALAEIERQTHADVLIIEDEPIIAMDIESIVRDLGHNVTGVAVTRDEAIAQARKSPPGLVLADIQLADDSSGIDAVKDILAEFSVPVIFITAFPERLLTGTRPEPTFLITKPFQRATVKAAISQALFFDAATVPAGLTVRLIGCGPPIVREPGRVESAGVGGRNESFGGLECMTWTDEQPEHLTTTEARAGTDAACAPAMCLASACCWWSSIFAVILFVAR